MRRIPLSTIMLIGALGASAAIACSGTTEEQQPSPSAGDTGGQDGFDFDGLPGDDDYASIDLEPKSATLEVDDGVPKTQTFKLVGVRKDGTKGEISSGVGWAATNPQVGEIAAGVFTAKGALGGPVQIKALLGGKSATADLLVKIKIQSDDATTDDAGKTSLRAATAKDATVKWAYPYDDTVWPRGLAGPTLMWIGGAPSDGYRVHLSSATFEYEGFAKVPQPARFAIPPKIWERFVESTSGAASLKVSRLAGATATVLADLKWTVAPGSMRGTIYYWSNREGRVLRIKPGATAPDDFSAGVLKPSEVLEDNNGAPHTSNCTMSCHRVSADGSTLISGGDTFGGAYDLKTNKPRHSITSTKLGERRAWNHAGPTPDGKYVVLHGNGNGGLYDTTNGAAVPGTGLEKVATWWPNFSPTGTALLFADWAAASPNRYGLFAMDYDAAGKKFANRRLLVDSNAVPALKFVSYSSASPDGQWAVYQRGSVNADTRGVCASGTCDYSNRADLYLAPIAAKGAEIALAKLNGTGYPFAAGARDTQWNFEPTFAPVASGGYFWVVFTSRRTYGNELQGPATTLAESKQLWVAAIDSTVTPGKDPSHAAFRLPGQALTYGAPPRNSLNMSGYWALSPCVADGTSCEAGSDCCGGFCEKKEGASTGSCKSTGGTCSAEGDRCNTADDCCGKGEGSRCIGGYCAQRPPS
jgi:hypothetical protein